MFKSLTNLSNLKKREEGQGLVEYALILVLVAVVVIVVLSLVGPGVGNIFSQVVGALNGDVVASEGGNNCVHYGLYNYGKPEGYVQFTNNVHSTSTPYYTDSNCSTPDPDGVTPDFPLVQAPSEAEALDLCKTVFPSTIRAAPSTGFYSCFNF